MNRIVYILLLIGSIPFFAACQKTVENAEWWVDFVRILADKNPNGKMKELELKYHKRDKRYFSDPKVQELCQAIDKQDTAKMKQLIMAGADVNAVCHKESSFLAGGNWERHTVKERIPLLVYAFPFGEKVVRCLLDHGADPNVCYEFESDRRYLLDMMIEKGRGRYRFLKQKDLYPYLEILLLYGADPELNEDISTLHLALGHLDDVRHNLQKQPNPLLVSLVNAGADLNRMSPKRKKDLEKIKRAGPDSTVEQSIRDYTRDAFAVGLAAKNKFFRDLLYLLESGAAYDPKTLPGGALHRTLYEYKQEMPRWTPEERRQREQEISGFDEVIRWLENKGISFDTPLPPGTEKPEPFRVNNKLIEMRKKNVEKQKNKKPE